MLGLGVWGVVSINNSSSTFLADRSTSTAATNLLHHPRGQVLRRPAPELNDPVHRRGPYSHIHIEHFLRYPRVAFELRGRPVAVSEVWVRCACVHRRHPRKPRGEFFYACVLASG